MNKKLKMIIAIALMTSTVFFQTFVMMPATPVIAAVPATSSGVNAFTDLTYLSDIDWDSATTSYYQHSPQKNKSIDLNKITLNGKTYAKGIGTHASSEIVYNSGVIKGGTTAKSINVNVTGVSQLKLVATDGGDGIDNDHADWANARIIN